MNNKLCVWTYDDDNEMYETDCDDAVCFIDGTPKDNSYKFCPYCGRIIIDAQPGGEAR